MREEINARKRGETSQGYTPPQVNYGGAPPNRAPRSGSSGGDEWKLKAQCHNCKEFGHIKPDCPKPRGPMKCHGCGKIGHTKSECRSGKDERGGRSYGSSRGDGYTTCRHCGNGGHTIEDCKMRMQDMGATARLAASSSTQFDASQSLLYTASNHAFSTTTNLKLPLLLDLGPTDHIFPSSGYFSEYSTTAVPLGSRFIYTADNKPHEVKGSGVVTLLLHRGTEETTIRLHALHVPTLGQTLVSLGCINRRGGVEFNLSKNGTPTLTLDGNTWADLKKTQNGLFLLSGHIVMPEKGVVCNDNSAKALTVGQDWHLRLGHPGLPMMHAMSSKGLIPKLSYPESFEISKCEICCQSKMAQSPHHIWMKITSNVGKWTKSIWT